MKGNWVITIGREFCSGGADTGRKVAEHFGIPYYDKEIIDKTAELLNMSVDDITAEDEKPAGFWDYPGYQYSNYWYAQDPSLMMPINMRVATAQFDAICGYAQSGPCVIIGRCADYVLQNRENVLSVFIRSDMEKRIERAQQLYGYGTAEAKKLLRRTDRIRANYYTRHTQQEWGNSESYNMILDAGKLGTDNAAAIIIHTIELLDK